MDSAERYSSPWGPTQTGVASKNETRTFIYCSLRFIGGVFSSAGCRAPSFAPGSVSTRSFRAQVGHALVQRSAPPTRCPRGRFRVIDAGVSYSGTDSFSAVWARGETRRPQLSGSFQLVPVTMKACWNAFLLAAIQSKNGIGTRLHGADAVRAQGVWSGMRPVFSVPKGNNCLLGKRFFFLFFCAPPFFHFPLWRTLQAQCSKTSQACQYKSRLSWAGPDVKVYPPGRLERSLLINAAVLLQLNIFELTSE